MAVLFTHTVLTDSRDPIINSLPPLRSIEENFISFLASLVTSMLICLRQHSTLVEEYPSLLGHFLDQEFWICQIKYAMESSLERALPQHRLVRTLPIRDWKHRQYPWPFRMNPSAGFRLPDSMIIYLPVQLCIWVAAYLKEAAPD